MKKFELIQSIVKNLKLTDDERFEIAVGLTRLSRDKLILMQRGMVANESQKRLTE